MPGRSRTIRRLSPADVPVDGLDDALAAAEATASLDSASSRRRRVHESIRQLERERAKLSAYFDYRDQAARDRLASSQQILANLEATDQTDSRRIIPVWRANVARNERLIEELATERVNQLAQLEQRATGGGDLRLVAVARVEITGGADE